MYIMKRQKIFAWVMLCTFMAELLPQQQLLGPSNTRSDLAVVVPGVSAFGISSSSSLSRTTSRGIRTQQQQQSRLTVLNTFPFTQQQSSPRKRISLSATSNEEETNSSSGSKSLPFYLDPNTKGGVVVLTIVLFLGTYITDQIFINVLNYDEIDAGITIGMGFTVLSTLAWMSTYLFRVATKDMTYVSYYSSCCFYFLS